MVQYMSGIDLSASLNLHPFSLSFALPTATYARLPLVMDGIPVIKIGCAISSRSAGNMVYSGETGGSIRDGFFYSLGLDPQGVKSCTQVHSRDVLAMDRYSAGRPQADGMVSRDRDIALAVTVADCLPVFLYDTKNRAFALLHSGWKGTGIVRNALSLMAELWGTAPEAIAALLGPCIHPCCYPVDEERAKAFEAEFGVESVRRRDGPPALDLQAANIRLLGDAGVRNIAYCEDCTFTDERLGSFRREGPNFTRMTAVMGFF
jgi:YfiH family protein